MRRLYYMTICPGCGKRHYSFKKPYDGWVNKLCKKCKNTIFWGLME